MREISRQEQEAKRQVIKIENITPEFLSTIKLPEATGKKLNYLIVLPVIPHDGDDAYPFPVGLAYVSAALKASGRNVATLNLNYKQEPIKLLEHTIIDKNIHVIMTGGFSVQFWELKVILDTAKNIKSDIITVAGGGLITADPPTAMEALENADYGVIGEGEITINALAHALENSYDPAELDGIICRRDGEWAIHENFPITHNLDALPFPDYDGFEFGMLFGKSEGSNSWTRVLDTSCIAYLYTSRSCPFQCTFCFHTCGNTYRQMSMDHIFKLVDWLRASYPIEAIWIGDELGFSNPQFAIEFCRRIKPYNLKWRANTHANSVTKEMLAAIQESGCTFLLLGIESADNNILKSMRKGITIERVETVLGFAAEVGLKMEGMLIFGDAEETIETAWRSINWWRSHRNWHAQTNRWDIILAMIRAYPGSHLYKIACEKGIIKDRVQFLKDGCPLVNVSKMTDDEYNVLPALFRSMLPSVNMLKNAKVKQRNDYAVSLSGQCPHCAEDLSFGSIETVCNLIVQLCPNCGKDINVNPIEYCDFNKLSKNAEALIQEKGAALWAITPYNFFWLAEAMPILKAEHVRFINNNDIILEGRTVKNLWDKEVFTPDIIQRQVIDTIIVPNGPKVFQDIRNQCAAEFPQVKQIVHVTDLI